LPEILREVMRGALSGAAAMREGANAARRRWERIVDVLMGMMKASCDGSGGL
jgi:hypothetical protein